MRKSILLIFILFFCVSSIRAQIWVPSIKSGETDLSSVYFQDKDTGYALSFSKVFRSTDAGKSWTRILNGYSKFSAITFSDKLNGVIVGYNDLVLKTSDGGRSWNLIRTGNSDDDFLTVYSMHKDTIYVLGPDDADTYKFANYLNVSYNGGQTWNRISTGSTQTIRTMFMWNKSMGIMGTLTSGVFKTTNAWSSYNVNWPSPSIQIIDSKVIKDSVVVLVGNNGRISRSNDYGVNFSQITSPVTTHLMSVDFVNDTFGMACGENGVILITRDAGLSWVQMNTSTQMKFYKIKLLNPYYGWAVGNSPVDSFDIYKFGSENYVAEKINFIAGNVSADLDRNCIKDSIQRGPERALVRVLPGPYYTYTEKNGSYSLAIPDSGTFSVDVQLPKKYQFGNGLCDSSFSGIYFNGFEKTVYRNFNFDFDTLVNLEIKVVSARKRRCSKNENVISFKNIGFRDADSVDIKLFYPDELIDIKSTSIKAQSQKGQLTFNLGKLAAGKEGSITVVDSVLCQNGVRGRSVCFYAVITPRILVKNTTWDTSWIHSRIDCKNDSIAIVKLFNTGKDMKDSALLDLYLDDVLTGDLKYKLPAGDSLRLEVEKKGKTITVIGDVKEHHPYQELMRVWKERCGNDTLTGGQNQVTKFEMQSLPPFETEFCLPIRDSYDPNDITVLPSGRESAHYIPNNKMLNYTIRFQNTGNDTAINIIVIDTLPYQLDEFSLELKGSSHKYQYDLKGSDNKTIVVFNFKDIYLVDSTTNEPGSNGWISFDIWPKKKYPHGTRIENFVDIYFDFNSPVRTNTAFVTIYDTIYTKPGNGIFVDCASHLKQRLADKIVCDQLTTDVNLAKVGKSTPLLYSLNTNIHVARINDTIFQLTASKPGKYLMYTAIEDCDQLLIDTAWFVFSQTPVVHLEDSLHCGDVYQLFKASCQDCGFIWSDKNTSDSMLVKKQGLYYVQLTNPCGIVSDTALVSALPILKLELGNDTLICDKSVLTLASPLTGNGFKWWDNSQNSTIDITTPGIYGAYYQDICNDLSDSIKVDFGISPKLNLGNDTGYCKTIELEIALDSTSEIQNIQWDNNSVNFIRQIDKDGLYYATLSNKCGIISDTIKVTKFEGSIPDFEVESICSIDKTVFKNTTYTNGLNALNYSWNFNDEGTSTTENPTFSFKSKGTKRIVLHAATSQGCVDSIEKQIQIENSLKAAFSVNDICDGDSAIFSNKTLFQDTGIYYKWRFGDGDVSNLENPKHVYPIGQGARTYLVTLVAEVGMDCRDSVVLPVDVRALPDATFGVDMIAARKFKLTANTPIGDYKYNWEFSDGLKDEGTEVIHEFAVSEKYTACLKVLSIEGCLQSDCEELKGPTGAIIAAKILVNIYPNPSKGEIHINLNKQDHYAMQIFRFDGSLVDEVAFNQTSYTYQFEAESKGIYLLRISDSLGNTTIQKIVLGNN